MNRSNLVAASCALSLALAGVACDGTDAESTVDGSVREDGASSTDAHLIRADVIIGDASTPPRDSSSDSKLDALLEAGTAMDCATSPDATDVDASAEVVEAIQAVTSAYCTALQTCCQQARLGDAATLDNCATAFTSATPEFGWASRGALVPSPTGLKSWVTAFQQAASDCLTPPDSVWDGVWTGTVPLGQGCFSSEECATDSGSDPVACLITATFSSATCPAEGACVAAPRAEAGAPCSSSCVSGEDCSYTLFGDAKSPLGICYENDGLICSLTCVPFTPLGGACTSDNDCGDLAYCDTTCKTRLAEGSACSNGDSCAEELYCANGVCSRLPFATASQCGGLLP